MAPSFFSALYSSKRLLPVLSALPVIIPPLPWFWRPPLIMSSLQYSLVSMLNQYTQVDREERPDVDRLYMTFLQATTGGGGWPMSVCKSLSLSSAALLLMPRIEHDLSAPCSFSPNCVCKCIYLRALFCLSPRAHTGFASLFCWGNLHSCVYSFVVPFPSLLHPACWACAKSVSLYGRRTSLRVSSAKF